jgi:hypothetical protein
LKGAIYSIHAKRKNNWKEKKMFTLSNGRVVGKNKIKCPNPQITGRADIKKLSNVNPIKY